MNALPIIHPKLIVIDPSIDILDSTIKRLTGTKNASNTEQKTPAKINHIDQSKNKIKQSSKKKPKG